MCKEVIRMKKIFTFLLLSSILLISCSAEPASKSGFNDDTKKIGITLKKDVPADFIPRDIKVVAIGDSLTQGVGDRTGRGGYVPFLKSMLEKEKGIKSVEISNYGIKGYRSDELLTRLKKPNIQKAIKDVDMVMITIGGNDMMKIIRKNFSNLNFELFEKEEELFAERLTNIFDTIRTINPNCEIGLVGLYNPFFKWFSNSPEMNEILKQWNETSQNVVAKYEDIYFIEVDDLFRNHEDELLYEDQFHPNEKGYELMAKRIYKKLDDQALPVFLKKKEIGIKEGARGE